jgi:hypothetical protein
LAYREIRDAGGSDQQAYEAAVEAVLQVLPLLSRKEASAEAVNAIAYATKYHRTDKETKFQASLEQYW